MLIEPFKPLPKLVRTALAEECSLLLACAAADARTHDIRFT